MGSDAKFCGVDAKFLRVHHGVDWEVDETVRIFTVFL
jgi:hypothetical protein